MVSSNYDTMDYQFKRCGMLNSNVYNTWAPLIIRPPNQVSEIEKPIDTHVIMNQISKLIKSELDCPIEVVREMNKIPLLTEKRKALYYRAIYQNISRYYKLSYMYNKYYDGVELNTGQYSAVEKNFIYSCKNNNKTPLNDIYKSEYFKSSKWI